MGKNNHPYWLKIQVNFELICIKPLIVMDALKEIDTFFTIAEAIKQEQTGDLRKFATSMGLTQRLLNQYKIKIENAFMCKVKYDNQKQTLYFEKKNKITPPLFELIK